MPAKTKTPNAAELMDMITKRAPALIAAGVTSLSIDGFAVTLAAPPAAAPGETPDPEPTAKSHINPLKDASTYPGGRVPGFTREDDL